jgi:hypothetical protein
VSSASAAGAGLGSGCGAGELGADGLGVDEPGADEPGADELGADGLGADVLEGCSPVGVADGVAVVDVAGGAGAVSSASATPGTAIDAPRTTAASTAGTSLRGDHEREAASNRELQGKRGTCLSIDAAVPELERPAGCRPIGYARTARRPPPSRAPHARRCQALSSSMPINRRPASVIEPDSDG